MGPDARQIDRRSDREQSDDVRYVRPLATTLTSSAAPSNAIATPTAPSKSVIARKLMLDVPRTSRGEHVDRMYRY